MKDLILLAAGLVCFQACVTTTQSTIVLSPEAMAVKLQYTEPKLNEWLHEKCHMGGLIEKTNKNEARIWAAKNHANLVEILLVRKWGDGYSYHQTFDGVGFFCPSFQNMPHNPATK